MLTQHHHYPSSHPASNKSNSGLVASLYLQAWYRNWKSKDVEHSPDVFHFVMALQGDRRRRFIWSNQRRFIRMGNPRILTTYLTRKNRQYVISTSSNDHFTSSRSGVTIHVAKFAMRTTYDALQGENSDIISSEVSGAIALTHNHLNRPNI